MDKMPDLLELEALLPLFVSECSTRLDCLEELLLALEQQPDDRPTLEALFRAAHSIKGNATVAHQVEVEWFAHIAESVLARLRDGSLKADGELVSVLLACCDHLRFLIARVGMDEASPAFAERDRTRLIGLLVPYLDGEEPGAPPGGGATDAPNCWHLRLNFGRDALRRGLDPLNFLQHLETLGQILSLQTCCERLPDDNYDPESCYLDFEVLLDSPADKQHIEDALAFASDVCELIILPPPAQAGRYLEKIEALPDDELHTGEMLVRIGAITPTELATSLRQQRQGATAPLGELLVTQGRISAEVVAAVIQRQQQTRQRRSPTQEQLHLPAAQVADLLASLHEAQAHCGELAASDPRLRRLQGLLAGVCQQAGALQATRFGEHLPRLQRAVREACRELGKQAELQVSGADVVLARSLASMLDEVLLQLLRNAVDHGIEPPATRLALGKPACGQLHIRLQQQGPLLQLRLSDDGAGLDREHILSRARSAGLASHADNSDQTVLDLLFSAGFTTVTTPTHYSGRGVGLDLVREHIHALGGSIHLASSPGQGCCFDITLPHQPPSDSPCPAPSAS